MQHSVQRGFQGYCLSLSGGFSASRLLGLSVASRLLGLPGGFSASRLLGFSACPAAPRLRGFSASRLLGLSGGFSASRLLGFSACAGLLGFSAVSASRLVSYFAASRLLGFSACFGLLGFSASRLLVAFLGPFCPCFVIFPVATNGASRTVSPQAKCLALPVKVRIEKFGFARFRNSGHTKNN